MKLIVITATLIALFSCATPINELNEIEIKVEKTCEYVKSITFESDDENEVESLIKFKKAVSKSGANSFQILETIHNGPKTKINGISYSCSKK